MKIEPAKQVNVSGLRSKVTDFWTRNVNAERIMGRKITDENRGSQEYFRDLQHQRYRSHRHLSPWIDSIRPGSRVLEVGSGIGMDSARIAKLGAEVVALDLTFVAARTAQENADREQLNAQFICADGENLPFPDSTFDYVFSFGVMHHAPDTEACVREAHRVLRKDGEALIMLYNRHSLNELVHRISKIPFEERDELCPVVRRFTKKEVRSMFSCFRQVSVHSDFVFGEGYGILLHLTPPPIYKILSKLAGWHLMIRAIR